MNGSVHGDIPRRTGLGTVFLVVAGLLLAWSCAPKGASSFRQPEPSRPAVADDTAAFAAFRQEAAAWRALSVKPALPEEARRAKVLAEDALQEKDFAGALGYYERGLVAAPLWPDGRFNAALICGELKKYDRAAHHMRRYLELTPDAPDAPAARDKLIIWEEKARKSAAESFEDEAPQKPQKPARGGGGLFRK